MLLLCEVVAVEVNDVGTRVLVNPIELVDIIEVVSVEVLVLVRVDM
jgi:hypothetical protein